jgi:dTDP-glucose 4,6-dehydratase
MKLPADQVAEAIEHCADIWGDLRDCRVFVAGGTGFLGRWTLAAMFEANRRYDLGLGVTCISRDPDRFRAAWPDLAVDSALELMAGDVRDFSFPAGRFKYVLHAATDTCSSADEEGFELLESLSVGTRRVIAFAESSGAQRMLFTSSGSVYGPQPVGVERMPETYSGASPSTDMRSVNCQGKRFDEQLCTIANNRQGIETVIARCFSFAGPGMDVGGHFAIGNFIRDAVRGETVVVKGDGSAVRSYLYASDTAAWLLKMLVKGRHGAAYNVGSDKPISIGDLANRVARLIPSAKGVRIEG